MEKLVILSCKNVTSVMLQSLIWLRLVGDCYRSLCSWRSLIFWVLTSKGIEESRVMLILCLHVISTVLIYNLWSGKHFVVMQISRKGYLTTYRCSANWMRIVALYIILVLVSVYCLIGVLCCLFSFSHVWNGKSLSKS